MEQDDDTSPEAGKPLLIYDGDCGFCNYWVRHWRGLTGNAVAYAPYQQVGHQYPGISEGEFRGGVQYIDGHGTHQGGGAKASFLTLSHAPGKKFWLGLYRHAPGFAPVSELVYGVIAKRRPLFHKISILLWGRDYDPPRHDLVSWLFLRLLGLIFLSAFISFAVQADVLIGPNGVLPLSEYTAMLKERLGGDRFRYYLMVFWFGSGLFAVKAVCWGGALFSLLLVAGVLPQLSLAALYILYLSLFYAGQTFMTFQWDLLLIEAGLLGLVLAFAQKQGIWLLRFLTFRFMLASGLVKITSGDPAWWDFSALTYHFETQPLPTPLAWQAHFLPDGALHFATGATLVIELMLPFLIFFPRHLRFITAFGFLGLESVILLTGNYNWFNLLSILLCLPLFDDAALRKIVPGRVAAWVKKAPAPSEAVKGVAGFAVILVVVLTAVQYQKRFLNPLNVPAPLHIIERTLAPLQMVNTYGPFAVMTKTRPEIIIEGSDDGANWREYEFKYKPGDVKRGAFYNIPHQPRIDWQFWFAAMQNPRQNPWLLRLMVRILEDKEEVQGLFRVNPFPDAPPRYARAVLYDYRFASPKERKEKGIYWRRQPLGLYVPPIQLNVTQ